MGSHTITWFLFGLLVFQNILVGKAKRRYVREHRGSNKALFQRTILSENNSENNSLERNRRGLEDYPCTYYYPTKKSKFNKYDDDWYDPCKTVESEYPTLSPSVIKIDSSLASSSKPAPGTRIPSPFFSTTPPVQPPSASAVPLIDPILEIVTEQSSPMSQRPTIIGPTISPSSLTPVKASSAAPIVSEETSVEVEIDVSNKENEPSCLQAKSGQVLPTSVNFTIHYKYELLAERETNMTGVVWPEVDRAFQRFLALMLIDCDINVEKNGASPTFRSRLISISPQPVDSVGSLYPNGWDKNTTVHSNDTLCTKINLSDDLLSEDKLYCDVVTGSITLYLSEVSYMNAANDPSILFLDYRDEVFQFLRDDINEGGESIFKYLDDSLGVRDLYFLSESTNLNLKPISTIPDAATNELNPSVPNKESFSSTPAIVGSLAAFFMFTLATGAFIIHRKRNNLDELSGTFKQNRTPRMDDNEMEFYDLDISDNESTDRAVFESSKIRKGKIFFPQEENAANHLLEPDDGLPEVSGSDSETIYGFDDKNSHHSASFDYSQSGVSMRLLSPGGPSSKCSASNFVSSTSLWTITASSRPDPSISDFGTEGQEFVLDPDLDHEQYPHDEVSTTIQKSTSLVQTPSSKSIDSAKSRSESSARKIEGKLLFTSSSTTTPLSNEGGSALDYILALGSTVLSTPNKPFDEASSFEESNDIELSNTVASSVQESSTFSTNNEVSERGERYAKADTSYNPLKPRDVPLNEYNIPNSEDRSVGKPIESPIQTTSFSSKSNSKTRMEYLKNRRKELETRFQNYRRSLSESMNNLNDSPSGSWSASREFSRSVSIYKNSDQSFLSPSISSSNAVIDNEMLGSTRATKKKQCGVVSTISNCTEEEELSEIDASSERVSEKRPTRTLKTPRVRKNYTSLNDIEEILEKENLLMDESTDNVYESKKVDQSLSPCNSKTIQEPIQFQADTVIL